MPSKRKQAAIAKHTRGRKKIILFLIEGDSEFRALHVPLANTCYALDPDIDVYFRQAVEEGNKPNSQVTVGDITSKYGVDPTTIEHVLDKLFLRPFFQEERLYTKDITRIVHLVDLDGAFIPNAHVKHRSDASAEIVYGTEFILTPNIEGIRDRNKRKRANLHHLIRLGSIKSTHDRRKRAIPYKVYFFSANLDHFLHDNSNLEQYQKLVMADDFSRECSLKPSLFFDTFQSDSLCAQCSYEESWARIQDGCNSLKRHSNLGVFLAELQKGF